MADLFKLPRAACPEEVGVDSHEIKGFLHDCDRMGLNMHSFMLIRHGKVAAECSWAPYSTEIPHTMFSFSKAVTGMAIGLAVTEGLIKLEDKVSKYFPSEGIVKDLKIKTKNDLITIYDLIIHRSGKNISIANNAEKNEWLQNWLNAPFKNDPGDKFHYLSENIYMLSRIVTKASGESLTDYLTPRLFEPLGITPPYWEKDHNGFDAGGWGAFLTPEDMGKIGMCYLNNGKFGDKQIFSEEWVKLATSVHLDKVPSVFNKNTAYGFQLFIYPEKEIFSFNGLYTQFDVMFKKDDAVFVCTAGEPQEDIFMKTLWKHFPAAFKDDIKPDEKAYNELLEYEKKMADRKPPMALRKPDMEAKINGRNISTTQKGTASILGTGNLFMLSHRAGQIDSFRFDFDEDELKVSFVEKNSDRNEIPVGLDGEYKFSEIVLSGIKIPVASFGTWLDATTFKLTVKPLNMAQYRELTFKFLPGGIVRINSSAKPGLRDLFEFYLMFNGTRPGKPLQAAITAVAKVATPILDPNFYGRIR